MLLNKLHQKNIQAVLELIDSFGFHQPLNKSETLTTLHKVCLVVLFELKAYNVKITMEINIKIIFFERENLLIQL